ncbi:hypothetical protein D3C78_1244750 [compost metagenome]
MLRARLAQRHYMLVINPVRGRYRKAAVLQSQLFDIPQRDNIRLFVLLVLLKIYRHLQHFLRDVRDTVGAGQDNIDKLVGIGMIECFPGHAVFLEHII